MTATTTVLTRVGWRYLYERPTSFFRFVGRLRYQVGPRGIGEGLCEAVVFEHLVHAQILYRYEAVAIDQSPAVLMGEVRALVLDALLQWVSRSATKRCAIRPESGG